MSSIPAIVFRDMQPLLGALRLAIFDIKGLTRIDDTQRGVWISFLAPLIVLPLMLWFTGLQAGGATEPGALFFLRQALGYIIVVFGFPVAMYYVARFLERGARYYLMVAAVNWTAPIQTFFMAVGYVFYFWDVVPGMGEIILMLASAYNMLFLWFTLRTSLDVSRGLAICLVCLMALIQLIGLLLTQVKFF